MSCVVTAVQAEHPIHVCASEREGFGHYINEARAAGALVVSTDHPPMNELITPGVKRECRLGCMPRGVCTAVLVVATAATRALF